jgi:hypothetical protein
MGKRQFVYKDRTTDDYKKRINQSGNQRDRLFIEGLDLFSVKDKKNTIRICPPTWEDFEHYGLDIWVHYRIGPDKSSFICPKRQSNEECPICNESEELLSEGKVKEADALKAKKRVLVWLIDRSAEDEGPKLWAMPWTVDRDIVKQAVDEDNGEVLRVDHHEDGYDVTFDKSGTQRNTEYFGVKISRRPSPMSPSGKTQEKWLEFIMDNPLPDIIVKHDFEYISKVFAAHSFVDEDANKDKKDEKESEDLTYASLCKMNRKRLEAIATDEADMSKRVFKDMEDEELVEAICDTLGLKMPKKQVAPPETEKEVEEKETPKDAKEKLAANMSKFKKGKA